jgi:hypothetical protein
MCAFFTSFIADRIDKNSSFDISSSYLATRLYEKNLTEIFFSKSEPKENSFFWTTLLGPLKNSASLFTKSKEILFPTVGTSAPLLTLIEEE